MERVFALVQSYQGAISLAVQLVLLVGMALLLHKINATKKRLEQISKLVSDYVTAVMEEETVSEEMPPEVYKAKVEASEKNMEELQQIQKIRREEKENRLISAVLQEIFP